MSKIGERNMGDFSFLTDAYGTYGYTQPAETVAVKRVSNNSVFLNGSWNRDQFACNRTGYTSNPIHLLHGVGPLWREPSSYSRWGTRIEGVTPGKYLVGPLKSLYVEDAYIDRANLNTAFSIADNNPHFFAGQTHLPKHSAGEVNNSRIKCEAKALADLASSKASMGENLAQLNQTVDLFGTVVDGSLDLYRAYRALRRGRFPKIKDLNARNLKRLVRERNVERRLANYWLSYWYGFKPLVSDAYGLYELMQEQALKSLLVHGRGRSSVQHSGHFEYVKQSSQLAPGLSFSDSSSVSHQMHLTGKVDGGYQLARNLNRIGMLNVPALAWELVPFSFVLDWKVPVGQVLTNLTATAGLTFVGGSSTVRYERELLASIASGWQIPGSGTSQPAYSHLWGFGMSRTKLTKFPRGMSLYEKPFFTGASRFATIASLLSNLTRGL